MRNLKTCTVPFLAQLKQPTSTSSLFLFLYIWISSLSHTGLLHSKINFNPTSREKNTQVMSVVSLQPFLVLVHNILPNTGKGVFFLLNHLFNVFFF